MYGPAAVLLENSMISVSLTQCAEGSGSEQELCSLSEPLLCCRPPHSGRGGGAGAPLLPVTADSASAAYDGTKRSSWPKCCRRKNEARLSEEFSLSVLPLLHEGDGAPDGVVSGPKEDKRCCNENSRKVSLGFLMTLLIAASWVGAAHMLKATFAASHSPANQRLVREGRLNVTEVSFDAPFFTTWVCASFNTFFFPIFLMGRLCSRTEKTTAKNVLIETLTQLQEKRFTFSQFFSRCGLFCLLWVITNYALVHSLRILDTTDVLALYASNVSFVYLLSWVILHEQFVGIRIVAVILCNTGIALLAYMDGVTRTITLGGVVLSAAAAAGSGVYKVTFKKLIGDVSFGQLSLFFTLIGFLNLLLMWPVLLALYLLRCETIVWSRMPWGMLAGAGALSLLANLLGNFGIVWTFEIFLTLGLAFAVPISAIVDVYMYEVMFEGMKLAGILLILIGFMLVLLPDDWPDYLTMMLRYRRTNRRRRSATKKPTPQDTATGHRSRLRTPSGRVK